MTEIVTRMKADWLRIANSLEQLDPTLAEASKRVFAELVNGAALYDRMEMLEAPIEFAMNQYELANTRLIEANSLIRSGSTPSSGMCSRSRSSRCLATRSCIS